MHFRGNCSKNMLDELSNTGSMKPGLSDITLAKTCKKCSKLWRSLLNASMDSMHFSFVYYLTRSLRLFQREDGQNSCMPPFRVIKISGYVFLQIMLENAWMYWWTWYRSKLVCSGSDWFFKDRRTLVGCASELVIWIILYNYIVIIILYYIILIFDPAASTASAASESNEPGNTEKIARALCSSGFSKSNEVWIAPWSCHGCYSASQG